MYPNRISPVQRLLLSGFGLQDLWFMVLCLQGLTLGFMTRDHHLGSIGP